MLCVQNDGAYVSSSSWDSFGFGAFEMFSRNEAVLCIFKVADGSELDPLRVRKLFYVT